VAAPPAARFARGAARAGWRRGAISYRLRSAALAAERRSVRQPAREPLYRREEFRCWGRWRIAAGSSWPVGVPRPAPQVGGVREFKVAPPVSCLVGGRVGIVGAHVGPAAHAASPVLPFILVARGASSAVPGPGRSHPLHGRRPVFEPGVRAGPRLKRRLPNERLQLTAAGGGVRRPWPAAAGPGVGPPAAAGRC